MIDFITALGVFLGGLGGLCGGVAALIKALHSMRRQASEG